MIDKMLNNLFSSLKSSFFVSSLLHFLLIISFSIGFVATPDVFISEFQDNTVLVDMIDIKDYNNLVFKHNEDNNDGKMIKKYSTIVKKDDEVEIKKVEEKIIEKIDHSTLEKEVLEKIEPDIVNNSQIVPLDKEILNKTQSDIIVSKPKPVLKPVSKVQKPSIKPVIKVDHELGSLLKTMDLVKVKDDLKGSEDGLIGKGDQQDYNKKKLISQSILTSIKSQFMRCWTVPVSSFEIKKINVLVHVVLNEDGSVKYASVINSSSYKNNEYFKIMANSAMQAIYKCNPILGLPKESHDLWKEIEFNFDPIDML